MPTSTRGGASAPKPSRSPQPSPPSLPRFAPSPVPVFAPPVAQAPKPAAAPESVVKMTPKAQATARASKIQSYAQQIAYHKGAIPTALVQTLKSEQENDPAFQSDLNAQLASVGKAHAAADLHDFLHHVIPKTYKDTVQAVAAFGGVTDSATPMLDSNGKPMLGPDGKPLMAHGDTIWIPGKGLVEGAARELGYGKTTEKVAARTFREGSASIDVPAARTRTGRVIQRAFDASRPVTSKLPGVMDEGQKFGQAVKNKAAVYQKGLNARVRVIKTLAHGLSPEELNAVRVVGEGLPADERAARHAEWAASATNADTRAYHTLHSNANREASKWTTVDDQGRSQFKNEEDFTSEKDKVKLRKLRAVYQAVEEGTHMREDVYRNLGLLHDEQIAARISGPGQVFRGARYKEIADIARENLNEVPQRAKFMSSMAAHGVPIPQVNALMKTADQAALRYAQQMENPEATAAFYDHLLDIHDLGQGEQIPGDAMHQGGTFGEDAAQALEEYAALARDIAKTLPEEDWPNWVHNQLRLQVHGPEKPIHLPDPNTPDFLPPDWLEQSTGSNFRAGDSPALDKKVSDADQLLRNAMGRHGNANDLMSADVFTPQTDPKILSAFEKGVAEGGIAPVEKGIFAAMRAAREVKDLDTDRKLLELIRSRPMFQKGGELEHISPYGYKGAISFQAGGATIHISEHADVSTFAHELAHYMRRYVLDDREQIAAGRAVGAQPIREMVNGKMKTVGYNFDREAEEKFAQQFEQYLRSGRAPASPLTQAFQSLAPAMRDLYASGELPEVEPGLGRLFDRMLSPKPLRGGRLEGGDPFNAGRIRVPYERGVPSSLGQKVRSVDAYFRNAGNIFSTLRRGQAVGTPADKALSKAFKGFLPLSGRFKIDPTNAITRDLMLAARISTADYVRSELLAAAEDLPRDVTDIPIKVDPKKGVKSKAISDLLDKMDAGEATAEDLKNIDWETHEAVRNQSIPNVIEGQAPAEAAYNAMLNQKPIYNIKWVRKEVIDATHMFDVPNSNKSLRWLGNRVTDINDVQKAMVLYLNPSYIPVNLIGNGVMNMMQQGFMMPRNMTWAVKSHSWMDALERTYMDELMGEGLTQSLSFKSAPGKIVHATLGKYINMAVDLMPRRAAFIHEARVAGYDTPQKIQQLLRGGLNNDKQALEDINRIQFKANDAIVDYDKMTPFEREAVARIIFFYPWLKGATRYTARFIQEHPLQAAGIAMAADHAFTVSNQILGDRPSYAQEDVPLSTRSLGLGVPGVGQVGLDSLVGEHTATGTDNLPMELSARQLLTFTTPFELFQAGIGWASGDKNASEAVQNLTPALYAAGVAAFGYDPFKSKAVNPGLRTFLSQLSPTNAMPLVQRLGAINMTGEQRKSFQNRSLNPRSRNEDIERLFLGGLTQQPYNREIGEERVHSSDPQWRLVHDSAKAGMGTPPPVVTEQLSTSMKLNHVLHKGDTPVDKVKSALPVYVKATGDHSFDKDVNGVTDYAEATAIYLAMRKIMFPDLNAWQNEMDKIINANLEAQSAGQ